MNLVESIFRGGFGLRADVTGNPAPYDDFWYRPVGGHASSSGMRVSPETSKRLGTVIACVSYRGKMVAMLPCKVRKDLAGGGSKKLPKHPWARALTIAPNPVQTAYDFYYMMNAHVDLRGNAFARKVIDGKKRELWPLHPDRMKVEVLKNTGLPIYKYENPLTNETETYLQEEILHVRDWSDGMYVGQSRISMGLDVFGGALARQDYAARWFKNDARTGLVMTGLNFKTKEDEIAYIKSIQEGNTGENRGRTMVLPPGADAKNLGVTPVDAQLVEGDKASDTKICSIFGVLPHAVGVDAGKAATFASTEQFNIMNAQQCVHPMLTMWEQCIQRDLLDEEDDGSYAKFSMAALLRGDNATRFAGYAIALQNGWMNEDEVRELEDLNPIPGGIGKTYWRSANVLPLAQLEAPEPNEPDNLEDGDAGDDGAGGDGNGAGDTKPVPAKPAPAKKPSKKAAANAALRGQLKMLATGTAERCVRRERSAVLRMIERSAQSGEIAEFYAEHARFVIGAFHLGAQASLTVMTSCTARGQQLAALLADDEDENGDAAKAWMEQVAAREAETLISLAVEGVQ